MTTTRFFLALMITAAIPALASAQLEIAVDDAYAPPPPVTIVQQPIAQQPVQQPVVQEPMEQPLVQEPDEPDLRATYAFGIWADMIDFGDIALTMRDPEISALTGVVIDSEWQGMSVLREPVLGGAMISAGMRADDWMRGPELRFMIGGSDIEPQWARAPGSELELAIESAMIARMELVVGVQAPLGAFRPYLQARFGIGGAWFDVAVRDARLGSLGTETVDELLCEIGGEAGFGILVSDEIELGFGVRASVNQLGGESFGGIFSMTVIAPRDE